MRRYLYGIVLITALAILPTAVGAVIVPGTSDPWLAGMPNGSPASLQDVAPNQSPVLALTNLIPGTPLTFSATGSVNFQPGVATDPPDGNLALFIPHATGSENGIANVTAPVNSLLGVFLDNSQPDASPAPAGLDFSLLGLNFASLSPGLKQVFFIGDGLTGAAQVQEFIVAPGATRLFLGTMDGFGWLNNIGQFDVQVNVVPVPASFLLLGSGFLGLTGWRRFRRNK